MGNIKRLLLGSLIILTQCAWSSGWQEDQKVNNLTVNGGGAVGQGYITIDSGNFYIQGNVGVGTWVTGGVLTIPSLKSASGTRTLCISTTGVVTSSSSGCTGT